MEKEKGSGCMEDKKINVTQEIKMEEERERK